MKRVYSKATIDKVGRLVRQYGATKAARASGVPRTTIREWIVRYKWKHDPDFADVKIDEKKLEQHAEDLSRLVYERDMARGELAKWKKLHQQQVQRNVELEEISKIAIADPPSITYIKPRVAKRREAAVVLVASDWHVEEEVLPEHVNGLNEYSQHIAQQRAETFFSSSVRIMEILGRDVEINTVVLALLGDFLTNDLHHDSQESNAAAPVDAALFARDLIASGISHLLKHTNAKLIIPCHSGNHGRFTQKIHNAHEAGHSLEYMMYRSLETHFSSSRVQWIVSRSYHSYLGLFGTTIRFHHGHAMRYGGGVGGLYIPVGQSVKTWNRTRYADLDVFGHFHQQRDGGSFLSNGSLIGYNAYALRHRYEFESPRQTLFLVDSRYGRTVTWPILVGEKTLDKRPGAAEAGSDSH